MVIQDPKHVSFVSVVVQAHRCEVCSSRLSPNPDTQNCQRYSTAKICQTAEATWPFGFVVLTLLGADGAIIDGQRRLRAAGEMLEILGVPTVRIESLPEAMPQRGIGKVCRVARTSKPAGGRSPVVGGESCN